MMIPMRMESFGNKYRISVQDYPSAPRFLIGNSIRWLEKRSCERENSSSSILFSVYLGVYNFFTSNNERRNEITDEVFVIYN